MGLRAVHRSPWWIAILCLFLLVAFWKSRHIKTTAPQLARHGRPVASSTSDISLDVESLDGLKLAHESKFDYTHICVHVRQDQRLGRSSVQAIDAALFANDTTRHDVQTGALQSQTTDRPCESNIDINVPAITRPNVDTSTIMLGVATTLGRLEQALPQMSRWLTDTGATLVVLLLHDPEDKRRERDVLPAIQQYIHDTLGSTIIFDHYHRTKLAEKTNRVDNDGLKNFALAETLWKHCKSNTDWFIVIDDDTFFVSLPEMLDSLQRHRNPRSNSYYIGQLSEGTERVHIESDARKAYGGAGIVLSRALMAKIGTTAVRERCESTAMVYGDQVWRDCIDSVTSLKTRLTRHQGLNQIDLWGRIEGWYEQGFEILLTIHHWRSWHFFDVPSAHVITDLAGPKSFLQRYRFSDKTVLTNGFSIVMYPKAVPDLSKAELTFVADVGKAAPSYDWEYSSFNGTRPAMPNEEKFTWGYRYTAKTRAGTVRQFYFRPGANGRPDSLIELDWRYIE